MHSRDSIYIDGSWVRPDGTETVEVVDPRYETPVATIPLGSVVDVDRAVRAAAAAFDAWSATSLEQRLKTLGRLHEAMEARADEFAATISAEMGAPEEFSRKVQVGMPLKTIASIQDIASAYEFEQEIGHSRVVREPIGVVAAITPWNYPLHQVMAKVVPALAAGCTVVLKPAQQTPLSAFLLADLIHEIGLPPGVFNLVPGRGSVIGDVLAGHELVDMVSFTGSTEAGRTVSATAAQTIKRVATELGGKSASVILEDVEGEQFDEAVRTSLANCLANTGQTCTAWTRLVVPRAKQERAIAILTEHAAQFVPGERLGPLASAAQRETVREYIQIGLGEGARLVTGSAESPTDRGYHLGPVVFSDVTSDMRIAQEEIFGPVLAVQPYDTEAEALAIANSTIYGLHGAVWSADKSLGTAFARRMRTGQVHINGMKPNPLAPFGGYRQSGNGRELGVFGLEEFLEVKTLGL